VHRLEKREKQAKATGLTQLESINPTLKFTPLSLYYIYPPSVASIFILFRHSYCSISISAENALIFFSILFLLLLLSGNQKVAELYFKIARFLAIAYTEKIMLKLKLKIIDFKVV